MNIASFLLPKAEVAYLRDDMTLRQGLEKLRRSGFSAIPVIDIEDRYVGVVGVGDFLWNAEESGAYMRAGFPAERKGEAGLHRYAHGESAGAREEPEFRAGD